MTAATAESIQTAQLLWKQAYKALSEDDAKILDKNASQHADLNDILVDKKLREKKFKEWTVIIAGKSVSVRQVGQKIVSFIDFSKDYIQQVASADPHTAIAWTCIASLLPVSIVFWNGIRRNLFVFGILSALYIEIDGLRRRLHICQV